MDVLLLNKAAVASSFVIMAVLVYLKSSKRLPSFMTKPFETSKSIDVRKTAGKDREWGKWQPVDWKAPVPKAIEQSPVDLRPLPYRPFKHNYFVTMGIRSMDWDEWIELDDQWDKFHDRKMKRLAQPNAHELFHVDPVAADAAAELVECMIDYLPQRYPKMFVKTDKGIKNLHTGEDFDCVTRPWKESPIVIAAKLVQDDLAIMVEAEDGHYYLKAGAILLAGFWRLKDKVHLPLREIHTSGGVPQYEEKLQGSMERFFLRMTPDKPVVRNNYFVQTDTDLAWSHAIGSEESDNIGWYTADNAATAEQLMFRSERQSLRRLPRSGAVVFTIRTYFLPIKELVYEPYVPGRLLDGISAWNDDVAGYKGLEKYKDVLLPYLEKHKQRQLDEHVIDEPEKEQYPF